MANIQTVWDHSFAKLRKSDKLELAQRSELFLTLTYEDVMPKGARHTCISSNYTSYISHSMYKSYIHSPYSCY